MTGATAGIYCRISLAAIGDTTKTDDQARICRELAARLGWKIAEDVGHPDTNGVYTDHARSAWQKKRKRPAWEQMLKDVTAGKINAIVVYHGDRLVRRPEDLTDLLRLADSKGVKLASPTGTKDLDTERLELWIRAAFAEEESQRHSERRKAQYERWRRDGKVRPGGRGGRAFGFDTKGNLVEAEKQLIQDAGQMILDGAGANEVARWLNDRGAVTPAGNQFTHSTVRKMLAAPRMAGLMPDGESKAAWPAILERADWEQIRVIIATRAAASGFVPSNARKHLLSGIATCSACGTGLQLRAESRKRGTVPGARDGYGCVKPGCRKVQRNIRLLDAYVGRRVWRLLNHPDNPAPRTPQQPGLAAEYARLTTARAELTAKVMDPEEPYVDLLRERLRRLDVRLGQLRGMSGDAARTRLIEAHRGLTWDEWLGLPLTTRRALVVATFRVVILPATRRGPGFETKDVRMTPL